MGSWSWMAPFQLAVLPIEGVCRRWAAKRPAFQTPTERSSACPDDFCYQLAAIDVQIRLNTTRRRKPSLEQVSHALTSMWRELGPVYHWPDSVTANFGAKIFLPPPLVDCG